MKNSKFVCFCVFFMCLNGVVGCGYLDGTWDKKYYKYKPTFQDRAVARSMVMDKEVLVDNSLKEMEPFLKPETLSDAGKKDAIKKALTGMLKDRDEDNRVATCVKNIREYINDSNVEQVKKTLGCLVDAAIEQEKKVYTVNGLKFNVKDNCIHFTDLDVSVPLTDVKVSDADVIGFSSDIQKALRWRMDTARRFRLGSGTAQILAASAGATLGFITKDVTTAAALAAFSAVIPEMQNIFQARDRSGAYEQGLELIQDAESRYYLNRTEKGEIEIVSVTKLTKEGGELLVQISACLKLVDKALLQTIPTIEDLYAAKGRLDEALGRIKVVPDNVNIGVDGTHTAKIINTKAIAYSVGNARVVKVENADKFGIGTEEINIKGVGEGGPTRITVYNALGHAGYFDVTVGEIRKFQVQTGSATYVGTKTAQLDGVITTDYPSVDVWFEYGTSPGCADFTKIGEKHYDATGVLQVDKIAIDNLSPGTPYYFRLVGSSTAGIRRGEPQPFRTSKVTTGAVSSKDETAATLTGGIITRDKTMECWFRYGTETEKYASEFDVVKKEMYEKDGSLNTVEKEITGLTKGKAYYYQFFAKNDAGEMQGGEKWFITKGTSVQTQPATNLGQNNATLNGAVTTGSPPINVRFDYGTETGKYTTRIDAKQKITTESILTPVTADISGLTPATYYFRIATDSIEGGEMSFKIPPTP